MSYEEEDTYQGQQTASRDPWADPDVCACVCVREREHKSKRQKHRHPW